VRRGTPTGCGRSRVRSDRRGGRRRCRRGSPGVDEVAFTGSTEVGIAISQAIAGTGKKLTLQLGG